MPFRSEKQRRFLWANHPDIARRWTNEYGSEPVSEHILPFNEWMRTGNYDFKSPGEPLYTDEFGRPEPVQWVQSVAQAYNALHGLGPIDHTYRELDVAAAGRVADAYDALPMDDSNNPVVAASYEALAREVIQQFKHAVASGMTFEPWTANGEAYVNPDENSGEYSSFEVFRMVEDVKNNHHMWFFTGGEPNKFMAAIEPTTGFPVNDLFRGIHDFFGHCAMGADFGPVGEQNAWVGHMQMFSEPARRALTVETRGQNSWVNFGKQNYDDNGNYLYLLPKDRPYASQKCAIFSGADEWINHL